jgi:hypothetical protein
MPTKSIDCPVCGSTMQKRVIDAGIEIDYCDWHGVWMDAGEMDRLFAARNAEPNAVKPGARQPGVGKAIAKGVAGAAVMGAGFHLGGRLVGGVLDALFNRRG